ncbi:MAG: DUF4837 family protein [Bacteroidaceae bacterium]|nr:DUF4837 family protein [Bacteroidaceae bacterium]
MRKIVSFLLVSVILAACSGNGERKRVLVASRGLPSELLLVVDRSVWDSDLQDTINSIVEGQVPGLLQAEKMFRVTRIFSNDTDPAYLTFHTKLAVRMDSSLDKPLMGTRRDEYARPQLELVVAAPSMEALRVYLSQNAERIRDILADAQIEFRAMELRKQYSKKVSDDLNRVLGMTICVPAHMGATKTGENFLWGSTNLIEKDLNLVVYTYDMPDGDVFNLEAFVAKRDSVMQKNIPGERPDQWMQTAREKGSPLVVGRRRKDDGQGVLEIRGLWEMRNGALGGPFVSIVRVDSAAGRVIVGEGFVYSPSTDKRDLVRQMEAALRTLK